MRIPKRLTMYDWLKAIALWLVLGASVSVYYTTARYDGGGWPLVYAEGFAATVVYYFFGLVSSAEAGGRLWFIVFPSVGIMWVSILYLASRFFGGRRANYSLTLIRFSVSALPFALAGIVVLFFAGSTPSGWSFNHMKEAGVYGTASVGWPWIDELYLAASLMGLAIQFRMSITAFGAPGRKALTHYAAGLVVLLVASGALGAGAGLIYGLIGA